MRLAHNKLLDTVSENNGILTTELYGNCLIIKISNASGVLTFKTTRAGEVKSLGTGLIELAKKMDNN